MTNAQWDVLFLLHGRCGSSLLQKLLYATGEFQLFGEPPPGENRIIDELLCYLDIKSDSEVEQTLVMEFERYNFDPSRRVLSKLPNYGLIVDILDRVFPGCRMICLERSVIDVVRSTAAAGWSGNVRNQYIEGAPGVKAALVADFHARTRLPVPDHDMAWVGLYTAFRYALARQRLANLAPERVLRVEFLDWMTHFRARSLEIAQFAQLDPCVVGVWEEQRYQAVQHTARASQGQICAKETFRQALVDLPKELHTFLECLSEIYGLSDLPHSHAEV